MYYMYRYKHKMYRNEVIVLVVVVVGGGRSVQSLLNEKFAECQLE